MAILNGSLADADEVMNAFGTLFNDVAQSVYNAQYIGWNASIGGDGVPDLDKLSFDVFNSDTDIDKTNTTAIYEGIDGELTTERKIVFASKIDDFEDDSIDANIWSTASTGEGSAPVESGGFLRMEVDGTSANGTSIATADQVNAPDFRAGSGNKVFYLKTDFSLSILGSTTGTVRTRLRLTDGTNDVALVTHSQVDAGTASGTDFVKVIVNDSAETVDVYVNGALASDDLDISSITGNWWLEAEADSVTSGPDGTTAQLDLFNFHVLLADAATTTFVSSAVTASSTITNAILTVNDDTSLGTNTSHAYALSADNGSNYESVTPNEIHRFTSTGTQLKVRITGTTTDAVSATTEDQATELFEYAVKYNWY